MIKVSKWMSSTSTVAWQAHKASNLWIKIIAHINPPYLKWRFWSKDPSSLAMLGEWGTFHQPGRGSTVECQMMRHLALTKYWIEALKWMKRLMMGLWELYRHETILPIAVQVFHPHFLCSFQTVQIIYPNLKCRHWKR